LLLAFLLALLDHRLWLGHVCNTVCGVRTRRSAQSVFRMDSQSRHCANRSSAIKMFRGAMSEGQDEEKVYAQ
jgi:hypothetical protein